MLRRKDFKNGKKIYFVSWLTGQISLAEIISCDVSPTYADRYRAYLCFKVFGKNGRGTLKCQYLYGDVETFQCLYLHATLKEAQEYQKSVKKTLGMKLVHDIKKLNLKIRRTKEKIMSLNTLANQPIWTPTVNKQVKAVKSSKKA